MLLSLERGFSRWSLRSLFSGDRADIPFWLGTFRPTGVEEHVQMDIRVSQELGRPCCFHGRDSREGVPGDQLQVRRPTRGDDGRHETSRVLHVVSLSEGNEVTREEQQGIGAS